MGYGDVFADVVNVLLFDGKRMLGKEELSRADMKTQFKADDGTLHEQERDVAMYWVREGKIQALIGLEPQTGVDEDMPLRICSYDGASYKSQLLQKDLDYRYPVVTLVLYFGESPWNGGSCLTERLSVTEELREFVED